MDFSVPLRGWTFSILIGVAMGSFPGLCPADSVLYAIDNQNPVLHVVNPLTGADESQIPITVPGE